MQGRLRLGSGRQLALWTRPRFSRPCLHPPARTAGRVGRYCWRSRLSSLAVNCLGGGPRPCRRPTPLPMLPWTRAAILRNPRSIESGAQASAAGDKGVATLALSSPAHPGCLTGPAAADYKQHIQDCSTVHSEFARQAGCGAGCSQVIVSPEVLVLRALRVRNCALQRIYHRPMVAPNLHSKHGWQVAVAGCVVSCSACDSHN